MAVVEGVGAHGCEYMTGGTVVVLGRVGWNFGAGMSGGEAFILQDQPDLEAHLNAEGVMAVPVHGEAGTRLSGLVERHARETGSPLARRLLESWPESQTRFVQVLPREAAKAHARKRA
jgi:glutamate synthase (NADPH/NADH) large chain